VVGVPASAGGVFNAGGVAERTPAALTAGAKTDAGRLGSEEPTSAAGAAMDPRPASMPALGTTISTAEAGRAKPKAARKETRSRLEVVTLRLLELEGSLFPRVRVGLGFRRRRRGRH